MEHSVKELVDLLFLMDEQERIEAKKASDIGKSVMETVCAFANEPGLGGGYLLLGVESAPGTKSGYRIAGISDPDKILGFSLREKCAPGAFKCRERRPSGRLLKTAKQTLGVPRLGLSPKTFVEKNCKGLSDLQTNCRTQFNVSLKMRTKTDLTGIDALPASSSLQKLKNLGFLEQKGQARSTYYVATSKLMSTLPPELGPLQKKLGPLGPELGSLASGKLVSLTPELVSLGKKVVSLEQELVSLPEGLQELVSEIGGRSSQEKIHQLILELSKWKALTKEQFGYLLKREPKLLKRRYLNPMKKEGLLEYTIPDMINHPRQAYRITEKGKRKLGGLEK